MRNRKLVIQRLALIMFLLVMVAGMGLMGKVATVSAETANSVQPTSQPDAQLLSGGSGFTLTAAFRDDYRFEALGAPGGRMGGSVAIDPSNPDYLYFGANNFSGFSGELYVIGLTRNMTGNITGYTGTAQLVESVTGVRSLEFMPNGTLLVGSEYVVGGGSRSEIRQYTAAALSQTLPISADLIIDMDASQLGPFPQPGKSFARVPNGFNDAGNIKFFDSREALFNLNPSATTTGTFTFSPTLDADYGPYFASGDDIRGIVFVPEGSPRFTDFGSVLLAESGVEDSLAAYELDSSRNPITSTRRVFATEGAGNGAFYGLALDPVTGDMLVLQTGPGNTETIVRVSGFNLPDTTAVGLQLATAQVPAPLIAVLFTTMLLMATLILVRPSKLKQSVLSCGDASQ